MNRRTLAELTGCTALALIAHLAIFADMPWREGGAETGGVGGDAAVSLEGANATLAAMVAEWETPPEVETEIVTAEPPPPPPPVTSPAPAATPDAPPPVAAAPV
ncbi:hypothetical protein ICN82_12195, partial [Mangrovicoccus sp. HB182678]|nr:hypothetical protein [Mangrovicoccus algicola]